MVSVALGGDRVRARHETLAGVLILGLSIFVSNECQNSFVISFVNIGGFQLGKLIFEFPFILLNVGNISHRLMREDWTMKLWTIVPPGTIPDLTYSPHTLNHPM